MIEPGLHERLVEEGEQSNLGNDNSRIEKVVSLEDQKRLVSLFIESKLGNLVSQSETKEELQNLVEQFSFLLGSKPLADDDGAFSELRWFSENSMLDAERLDNQRPFTPLTEQALFTNAKDEPRIDIELERELATADSVEILVSFIKISGLRLLEGQLRKLRDRGVPVRLVTTTYMGATDKKAIDRLVDELGVSVKIDLLPNSNRLHAKAWLFNRRSGYSTAVIGSSNMSRAALTSGSEWNVRLSQVSAPELFEKFRTSFETYWESDDYHLYSSSELGPALEEALRLQSGHHATASQLISQLEVSPRPHQLRMLEDLRVAREVFGYSRNLVVAATGTGKTVLAALDYKSTIQSGRPRPKLLFIAHRKEILQQALMTFRQVLGDSEFGELFVDGIRPHTWTHVFASIQSLSSVLLEGLGKDHFEHLIVDEFHHAEAKSYAKLFTDVQADQVLGLTATPERTDGVDQIWQSEFGGRIASELRLWDALSQDLLAPFHYFGIGEELDFSSLPWVGGRYDISAMSNLVTSNTLRNKRVLKELSGKSADLTRIKALIFCVSVEHANQVAEDFTREGIITRAVTATTPNRHKTIQELRSGGIQAIATVDVFNEGVDIPEVDTIVLLRPTESPTIFLQQIGRGLRRSAGKDNVLILDFIGAHRSEFRIDKKYEALSGLPRAGVLKNLKEGFPYLPSGSAIQLDGLGRDYVLDLMKKQIAPNWRNLVDEIRSYGVSDLSEYLKVSGRDIFEIYRTRGKSWSRALIDAGLSHEEISAEDETLIAKVNRLLHVDDADRLEGYQLLISNSRPSWESMDISQRKLASMLFWNLFEDGVNPQSKKEWSSINQALNALSSSRNFVNEITNLFEALKLKIQIVGKQFDLLSGETPLRAHATYSRYELLGALGYGHLPGSSVFEDGSTRTLASLREGAYFVPEAKADLFLVTLQKSERLSPSVRYHDYAISPRLFHWESQNRNSAESKAGQRYISQKNGLHDVLIAVRHTEKSEFGTQHFTLLGPADYVKHEGSKPVAIWWRLRVPMSLGTFEQAAAAKVS